MTSSTGHNPSGPPRAKHGASASSDTPKGGAPAAGRPARGGPPAPMSVDINEYGGERDGVRQQMDRRLFMQFLVFDCAPGSDPVDAGKGIAAALEAAGSPGVVYEDVNDPRALALLTWAEDPAHFVTTVRPIFRGVEFAHLTQRPAFTMFGRTYSSGYEPDLEYWIIRRPEETALNPDWPWAVWYPLRRSGEFAKLEGREQGKILREHAVIGRAYGEKGMAHDIRLACHGLDTNDNEFIIGLVGDNLHRLSHVVQTMRKTTQTSTYITQMGPFFVGHAVHRVAPRAAATGD